MPAWKLAAKSPVAAGEVAPFRFLDLGVGGCWLVCLGLSRVYIGLEGLRFRVVFVTAYLSAELSQHKASCRRQ